MDEGVEMNEVSNCCGVSIIENTDLCSDCKEHCEIVSEKTYFEGDLAWLSPEWIPETVTHYTNRKDK